MLKRKKKKMLSQKKPVMSFSLVMLVVSMLWLGSCGSRQVILYPITDKDIFIKDGNICMSQFYFNEVLQAKIKAK